MRAFSLFLVAVGAILTFAVTVFVDGVDLKMVGIILMVVGAVGFLAGMVRGAGGTSTRREVSADGRTLVEDSRFQTF